MRVAALAGFLGAGACAALLATPARAGDEDVERRALPDFVRVPSDAAVAFDEGERARHAGKFEDAARAYARAGGLAQEYAPFARRECGALVAAGRHADAVARCRRAVELDASPMNRLGLATALSSSGANDADLREARDLVFAAAPARGERDPVTSCETVVMTTAASMTDCLAPILGRERTPARPPAPSPWRRAMPFATVALASVVVFLAARALRRAHRR